MSSEVSCGRLELAREGEISLEEATFPPMSAPPPPPPLLLPLAIQILHTLFTLKKQPCSLKMDSTHQSNPIPAGSLQEIPFLFSDCLPGFTPPVLPFLVFHTTEGLMGCCKQRSVRQAPSPFTLQLV